MKFGALGIEMVELRGMMRMPDGADAVAVKEPA